MTWRRWCDSALPGRREFICLGDYANSRGAADMGLYPDLLPGYAPLASGSIFDSGVGRADSGAARLEPCADARCGSRPQAACPVRGRLEPRCALRGGPFVLHAPFLVVQDMFMTETAMLADVVLPAANAYEKAGTFTNTCGDLQLLKKAGDVRWRQERLRNHRADCGKDGFRHP